MAKTAPELSPSELAALDFMIAYMKEHNQAALGFFGSIFHAVAKAASSAFTDVTKGVTDLAHGDVTGGLTNLAKAVPSVVTSATSAAELTGASIASSAELQSVVQQVQESAQKLEGLTLDDLIRIRNQYSK